MEAAQKAVDEFSETLRKRRGKAGEISIVAMNNRGEWGIGTNVEFTFCVGTETEKPQVYISTPQENGEIKIEVASEEYMKAYKERIQRGI